MTNAEKFKEIFGFTHGKRLCVAPQTVCDEQALKHIGETVDECKDCPFYDWWDKEYKACFQIRSDYE